jgi:chemotaxis protein CheY-P-specific phosphatase CheC
MADAQSLDPRRIDDRNDAKAAIDRLTELANIGAGHAAGAFAQLVGRTIWTEVPLVAQGDESSFARPVLRAQDRLESPWCTGVFFEFDGCLDALVGILFPEKASEALVRRIVGIEDGEIEPAMIESALMEVGNILASHVASAIADTLGARLLPSIPILAMEDADEAFSDWVESRVGPGALRIESGLRDETNALRGRLILVPTRISDQAPPAGEL